MSIDNKQAVGSSRRTFLKKVGVGASGAAVSSIAGCAGGNSGDENTEGSDDTESSTSEESMVGGEFIAGVEADITKVDPHTMSSYSSSQVMENIYEPLTIIDKELKPVGRLATDWSVSNDGNTWTVTLQEGVMFHPPVDREMTAEDVVYSIERILDEDTGSPRRSNFTPIESVSADGDYTVVFELKNPYAPFLTKLTTGYVVPKNADESDSIDLSSEPVGTGPFKWGEHVSDSHTRIDKFEDYWGTDDSGTQFPYLDSVKFQPIPEGSARVTAVKTGEVDWVDSVPRSQASSLEDSENIVFSNIPGTLVDNVSFNTNESITGDLKFRQAVAWIIDRPSMVQGARFGYAQPTHTTIPPDSAWKDLITFDGAREQNFEKARELLEESSYDGEKVTIKAPAPYQEEVNEAQILQEAGGEVDINFEVKPTEWGTFVNDLNDGNWEIVVMGWLGFTDPDDWFYNFFHTGEKWNFQGYSNEEVDRLLEQGRQATESREGRAEYYDKAADIVFEDASWIPLIFNQDIMVWKPYVENFTHIATRVTRFRETWLNQ